MSIVCKHSNLYRAFAITTALAVLPAMAQTTATDIGTLDAQTVGHLPNSHGSSICVAKAISQFQIAP